MFATAAVFVFGPGLRFADIRCEGVDEGVCVGAGEDFLGVVVAYFSFVCWVCVFAVWVGEWYGVLADGVVVFGGGSAARKVYSLYSFYGGVVVWPVPFGFVFSYHVEVVYEWFGYCCGRTDVVGDVYGECVAVGFVYCVCVIQVVVCDFDSA